MFKISIIIILLAIVGVGGFLLYEYLSFNNFTANLSFDNPSTDYSSAQDTKLMPVDPVSADDVSSTDEFTYCGKTSETTNFSDQGLVLNFTDQSVYQCFLQKFKTCTPASMTVEVDVYGDMEQTHQIIGLSGNSCQIRLIYTNITEYPSLDGTNEVCTFDNSRDYSQEYLNSKGDKNKCSQNLLTEVFKIKN